MPLRVVVLDTPQMLKSIVLRILAAEPDFEVKTVPDTDQAIVDTLQRDGPHVIVALVTERAVNRIWNLARRTQTHTDIVGLVRDGRQAFLYKLRPDRIALGDLSPQDLVLAIRRSVSEDREDPPLAEETAHAP